VELQEGADFGRTFPPRALSNRVVLSTPIDAGQYRNQRKTSIQHRWLQIESDATMTESSDSPQI